MQPDRYSLGLLLVIFCGSAAGTPSTSTAPKGWGVQYVDASCVVDTRVPGSGPGEPDWLVKMGHLHGQQLVFIVSFKYKAFDSLKGKWPDGTTFLTVGSAEFKPIGVSLQRDEAVLAIENGLNLQRALRDTKELGIKFVRTDGKAISIARLTINNIHGAMEWLSRCNAMGVGAVPASH